MPRNTEIKARVADLGALEAAVRRLATDGPYRFSQHDTFYRVPEGRFKLRRFDDGRAELLYYRRPDSRSPAASSYLQVSIEHAVSMATLLSAALGAIGDVKKARTLYWIGQTRVHLDQVDGLGAFMELEVTLSDPESEADGERVALGLMQELGIDGEDLVAQAYIDLILA